MFPDWLIILCLTASLRAQLVKNSPAVQEIPVQSLGREDPLDKGKATHSSVLGLPCGSAGKESPCNVGDLGSGLGRSPGEEKGYPLQYSGLENSTTVHGVAKSQTRLSDFHLLFYTFNIGLDLPTGLL